MADTEKLIELREHLEESVRYAAYIDILIKDLGFVKAIDLQHILDMTSHAAGSLSIARARLKGRKCLKKIDV